jgi:hypothetical protein
VARLALARYARQISPVRSDPGVEYGSSVRRAGPRGYPFKACGPASVGDSLVPRFKIGFSLALDCNN